MKRNEEKRGKVGREGRERGGAETQVIKRKLNKAREKSRRERNGKKP